MSSNSINVRKAYAKTIEHSLFASHIPLAQWLGHMHPVLVESLICHRRLKFPERVSLSTAALVVVQFGLTYEDMKHPLYTLSQFSYF